MSLEKIPKVILGVIHKKIPLPVQASQKKSQSLMFHPFGGAKTSHQKLKLFSNKLMVAPHRLLCLRSRLNTQFS